MKNIFKCIGIIALLIGGTAAFAETDITFTGKPARAIYNNLSIAETNMDPEYFFMMKTTDKLLCSYHRTDTDPSSYYCTGTAEAIYENLSLPEESLDAEGYIYRKAIDGILCLHNRRIADADIAYTCVKN